MSEISAAIGFNLIVISWIEIIEYILSKGKPTLIATGASSLDDVKRVMHLTKKYQNDIVNTTGPGVFTNSLQQIYKATYSDSLKWSDVNN